MLAVAAALVLSVSMPAKAQFGGDKATVGFNVGASAIGMLFNMMNFSDVAELKASSTPPIQFSYDYKVGDKFSVGGAFSFSHSSLEYNDPSMPNIPDSALQNFNLSLNRFTIAARGLWYYTDNDRLDLYSGLRVGLNLWPYKVESTDPDVALDLNPLGEGIFSNAIYPNFQIIYFGGTAFVTDNIGINWELCAGQPYFAAIGLRYRFD